MKLEILKNQPALPHRPQPQRTQTKKWDGSFFISTKGALRRPMTYDNHPIHPCIHPNPQIVLKTTSHELRCFKMH